MRVAIDSPPGALRLFLNCPKCKLTMFVDVADIATSHNRTNPAFCSIRVSTVCPTCKTEINFVPSDKYDVGVCGECKINLTESVDHLPTCSYFENLDEREPTPEITDFETVA